MKFLIFSWITLTFVYLFFHFLSSNIFYAPRMTETKALLSGNSKSSPRGRPLGAPQRQRAWSPACDVDFRQPHAALLRPGTSAPPGLCSACSHLPGLVGWMNLNVLTTSLNMTLSLRTSFAFLPCQTPHVTQLSSRQNPHSLLGAPQMLKTHLCRAHPILLQFWLLFISPIRRWPSGKKRPATLSLSYIWSSV